MHARWKKSTTIQYPGGSGQRELQIQMLSESGQALDPAFLPSLTSDYSNYWLMISLSVTSVSEIPPWTRKKKPVSWWKFNGNWYISTNCFSFDKSAFSHEKQCQKLSTSSNSNQINSGMNASRKFLLNTSCLSKGKLLLPPDDLPRGEKALKPIWKKKGLAVPSVTTTMAFRARGKKKKKKSLLEKNEQTLTNQHLVFLPPLLVLLFL